MLNLLVFVGLQRRYDEFKESLEKNYVNASSSVSRDHAPIIQVQGLLKLKV